ncbi:MAG TPA: hypothetical protein VNK67_03250 [Burkholderiales bacterium]|nr:hypothetical protein [Burkholderiales bacterium]
MRKANERTYYSNVYALLEQVPMSASERQVAISAMQSAEAIADALLWVREKFEGLGAFFLKPGLKH